MSFDYDDEETTTAPTFVTVVVRSDMDGSGSPEVMGVVQGDGDAIQQFIDKLEAEHKKEVHEKWEKLGGENSKYSLKEMLSWVVYHYQTTRHPITVL